jgi:hypothetical protein
MDLEGSENIKGCRDSETNGDGLSIGGGIGTFV